MTKAQVWLVLLRNEGGKLLAVLLQGEGCDFKGILCRTRQQKTTRRLEKIQANPSESSPVTHPKCEAVSETSPVLTGRHRLLVNDSHQSFLLHSKVVDYQTLRVGGSPNTSVDFFKAWQWRSAVHNLTRRLCLQQQPASQLLSQIFFSSWWQSERLGRAVTQSVFVGRWFTNVLRYRSVLSRCVRGCPVRHEQSEQGDMFWTAARSGDRSVFGTPPPADLLRRFTL